MSVCDIYDLSSSNASNTRKTGLTRALRRKPADSRRVWPLSSSMRSSRSLQDFLVLGADLGEKLGQEGLIRSQTIRSNKLRRRPVECLHFGWFLVVGKHALG
ncbi:hypothetical protein QQF64_005238 [Cirrhinus molitorella]|uniref:Uncharacterized protein n=1 Tax=Cirrhinus molitorella TaxID=172907 RepID=A0ABR3MIK4_9TELE